MKELITRQESQAMRGIAILAIMLHNFTHWLGPMVKENEYTFSVHNVRRLMVELANPSWDLFAHLLSFFGHYGVPVFLFLSAYGLVMKYESAPALSKASASKGISSAWEFVSSHYRKLFLMMVVGYSLFVLVDYMTPRPRHYEFWNVVGELGMFSNLYAEPHHAIWPGPYWYFGLMVQIYIVYRFLLYPGKCSLMGILSPRWGNVMMVCVLLVTLLAQLLFEPESEQLNWYRYNVFGALPVFIFGLLYARCMKDRDTTVLHWILMSVIAIFMVMFFSMNFICWIIVPFFICIGTLSIVKCLPVCLLNPLAWVGSVSAAMFVCHPITRKVLIPIAHRGDVYAGLVLYLVATIILAILFKKMINLISQSKDK